MSHGVAVVFLCFRGGSYLDDLPRNFLMAPKINSPSKSSSYFISWSVLVIIGTLTLLLFACTQPTLPPSPSQLPSSSRSVNVLPPTWTPNPTIESSQTPVPTLRPTLTPDPTATQGATLPPPPTAFPSVQTASIDNQPFLTHHLLFSDESTLKIWDRDSGLIENFPIVEGANDLFGKIQSYSISEDASTLGFIQVGKSGNLELVLFNLLVNDVRWILPLKSQEILNLSISPDGRWIAYIDPDNLIVVPSEMPELAAAISDCGSDCSGIMWAKDSQSFVWGDRNGLWGAEPELGEPTIPEMILEPYFVSLSAGGEKVFGIYFPISWSPSDRYLILSKGDFKESPRVVFDIQSGRVEEIPGPFLYVDIDLSLTWLENDVLLIARASLLGQDNRNTSIEILRIDSDSETMFVRENAIEVGSNPADVPFAPIQMGDGRIFFAMLNFSSPNYIVTNGIYLLDPISGVSQKLNDLPFGRVQGVTWVPDGSAMLMFTERKAYFVPADGSQVFDVRFFLGPMACCFYWLL